jgi:enoyl-CoA hydratase/carnithine racemase
MTAVLIHTEAGVTTLTLDRVAAKNALTGDMYAAMADALAVAATDPSQRVVLIQGHASVFTAGNDIGDFMNNPPTQAGAPVHRFLEAIAAFPKPLLAAVCGPAVGVGTTMLLHCDLVYAGDNAMFALPFVNLGLCPEAASSLLLVQLMGHQRAAQALMLGDPFSAEAALEVGLVNSVLPPTEVNAYAQKQAQRLAAKPAEALMQTKRLMKSHQAESVRSAMGAEGEVFKRLLTAPAAKEAFSAFLEKRKPDFSRV